MTDEELKQLVQTNSTILQLVLEKIKEIEINNEKFNDKFDNYQKATQWVVQLAFSLIASATLTLIITSVFRR